MRFGCCVTPEQIEIVARAGYDFCELPARAVLPFEDDAAALPALREIGAAALRPEAFNVLVPPELPMVGPRADLVALRAYLRRAFRRMVQLGGAVVVLGSGAARRIPAGMPREQALDQLAAALALAADEAGRAGITLALEHLNQGETNVGTSLAECQALVEHLGRDNVRLLADLYHLAVNGDDLDALAAKHISRIGHVQIADAPGRHQPGTGALDIEGHLAKLQNAGYDGFVGIEYVPEPDTETSLTWLPKTRRGRA